MRSDEALHDDHMERDQLLWLLVIVLGVLGRLGIRVDGLRERVLYSVR